MTTELETVEAQPVLSPLPPKPPSEQEMYKMTLWGRIAANSIRPAKKVTVNGVSKSVMSFILEIRRQDKQTKEWSTLRYNVTLWEELADYWNVKGRLVEGAVVSAFGKLKFVNKEGLPCLEMTAYKLALDVNNVYIPQTSGSWYSYEDLDDDWDDYMSW